jgi:ADP-ribose pyrophosphatase YjhB (NUDIX family)
MDQKLINPLMKTSCGFVIYCEGSNEILLGRETNSNNFWSIPKGGKEDGENFGMLIVPLKYWRDPNTSK